jgi:LysR family transcriptional regulator, glycine cleavage system transcriptional activator
MQLEELLKLPGVHLSHTANALQLAMSGRGVAPTRDCLIADAIESGSLVCPVNVRLPLPRTCYLVYSESVANLAKIAAFRDWLLSEMTPFR